MNTHRLLAPALLILVSIGCSSARAQGPADGNAAHEASCGGEPCAAVFRGLLAFFDRELHDGDKSLAGNGRSCNDCHMASDRFRLTPANAEKRFQLLQLLRRYNPKADDPLFRPIDADDFRVNGDLANDYSNLRQNGLIRVTFPLPANIRLIDPVTHQPSAETSVDVWRKVPSVLDVKLTGADGTNPWAREPNTTGGYQHDGRFLTLQEQALGALTTHAQVQSLPSQRMLNDFSSFQRVLFSNERVRALSKAVDDAVTPLPDTDPKLNALEQQGKLVFIRACAHCHGGPGQSTTKAPVVRYHDIFTQCPRPVDTASPARFNLSPCAPGLERNAREYEITLPNGAKVRRVSSDPGRALLTGFVGGPPPFDDWNKLDVPGLRDIRNKAPYFHNNSAKTLEEVVDHYIEFFKRVKTTAPPGPVPPVASTDGVNFDRIPLPEERDALLAYLRKL